MSRLRNGATWRAFPGGQVIAGLALAWVRGGLILALR